MAKEKITNKELIEFAKIIDGHMAKRINELRAEFDDTLMALAPPPEEEQVKEIPKVISKSGIKKVQLVVENNDGKTYRYTVQ